MRKSIGKRRLALGLVVWPIAGLGMPGCVHEPCVPADSAAGTKQAPLDDLDSLNERELARRLLDATGGDELASTVVDQMLESFIASRTLSAEFVSRFREKADPDELNERIVDVYVKHYRRETMVAAIRFYESEQGRVMVKRMPQVTSEGMAVGAAWGRGIAEKVMEEANP